MADCGRESGGQDTDPARRMVQPTLRRRVLSRDLVDCQGLGGADGVCFIEVANPTDQSRRRVVLTKQRQGILVSLSAAQRRVVPAK